MICQLNSVLRYIFISEIFFFFSKSFSTCFASTIPGFAESIIKNSVRNILYSFQQIRLQIFLRASDNGLQYLFIVTLPQAEQIAEFFVRDIIRRN